MAPEARQAWLCPRCPNVTDVIGDSATCAGALTLGTAHDPCPMVLGVASAPEGRQAMILVRRHDREIWREANPVNVPKLAHAGWQVKTVYEHPPAADREFARQNERAFADNLRLRKALAFYADPDAWQMHGITTPPAQMDAGRAARAAIAALARGAGGDTG